MKKYSSMTAEVKDIIMKVMADGKEHSRQELLKNVEAEMEKPGELREGVYTGSIKILVGNGNLLTVSRGTYQLNLSASKDMELKRRVYLIIEGCKEQLSRSCSGVSLLGINEEAIQLASEVNEIIAYLNDVSARLDDTVVRQIRISSFLHFI